MRQPLLTLQQACDLLQVSYMTLRRLVLRGQIRAAKVGGGWRIDPADLDVYLALQKAAAHGPTVTAAVAAAFDADDLLDSIDKTHFS